MNRQAITDPKPRMAFYSFIFIVIHFRFSPLRRNFQFKCVLSFHFRFVGITRTIFQRRLKTKTIHFTCYCILWHRDVYGWMEYSNMARSNKFLENMFMFRLNISYVNSGKCTQLEPWKLNRNKGIFTFQCYDFGFVLSSLLISYFL